MISSTPRFAQCTAERVIALIHRFSNQRWAKSIVIWEMNASQEFNIKHQLIRVLNWSSCRALHLYIYHMACELINIWYMEVHERRKCIYYEWAFYISGRWWMISLVKNPKFWRNFCYILKQVLHLYSPRKMLPICFGNFSCKTVRHRESVRVFVCVFVGFGSEARHKIQPSLSSFWKLRTKSS